MKRDGEERIEKGKVNEKGWGERKEMIEKGEVNEKGTGHC